MLSRIRNWFRHSPLLLALLFALTFRGVMPVGYMPVAADGALRIVMCSGIVLPGDSGSAPVPATGSAHDGESACPFAASATPALSMPAIVFAVAPVQTGPVSGPRPQSSSTFALVRAQQARAPPLSIQIES